MFESFDMWFGLVWFWVITYIISIHIEIRTSIVEVGNFLIKCNVNQHNGKHFAVTSLLSGYNGYYVRITVNSIDSQIRGSFHCQISSGGDVVIRRFSSRKWLLCLWLQHIFSHLPCHKHYKWISWFVLFFSLTVTSAGKQKKKHTWCTVKMASKKNTVKKRKKWKNRIAVPQSDQPEDEILDSCLECSGP